MSRAAARTVVAANLAVATLLPGRAFAQSATGSLPSREEAPTEMHSPRAVVGGVVLASLGALPLATGVIGANEGKPGSEVIVLPLVGLGIASIAGGAVLVLWGARSVPARPSWASAIPTVNVGPTRASARWAF